MATSSILRVARRFARKAGGYKKLSVILLCTGFIIYMTCSLWTNEGPTVWDVEVMSVNKTTNVCDISCLPDQLSFYIRSGEKSDRGPTICFQGKMYMSHELRNVDRGMNVVLVDSKSQAVKYIKVFDTYIGENNLLRFLKRTVGPDDIVMMTTFDDATTALREGGRHWLQLFGSVLIKNLKFRENFIFIGQRGLQEGKAIEYYQSKKKKEQFAVPIEKAGCFSFPLGNTRSVEKELPKVYKGSEIQTGEKLINCGLPEACPAETVAVAVDTGLGNQRSPSICLDGYIRMGANTNGAGRGFNFLTVDPKTLKPYAATHIDTYDYDSSDLEIFLDDLPNKTIIISVVADDASSKLQQTARDLLNQLGSGLIQNLRFRDVWYFIGQKGMNGFTVLEKLSFSGIGGAWPKPLTDKLCVPKILPTRLTVPDPEYNRNDKRREFCMKYEGYVDFCDPVYVDDPLETISVFKKEMKGHKIFDTPIIIVPGINHNAFVQTLMTTLLQPGIKIEMVTVLWDEKLPEYKDLTQLFGFKEASLPSSESYSSQFNKALKMAKEKYPNMDHMMFVEEDLLLAPDFLPFMAASLDVMKFDASLIGASAWNINGFENVSGNVGEVYRVQDFPGLGFLVKMAILQELMPALDDCCKERAWHGWKLAAVGKEMLTPDMSRVYRTPFYGPMSSSSLARDLFLKPRMTNLNIYNNTVDISRLQSEQYETFLNDQIKKATTLTPALLEDCMEGKAPSPVLDNDLKGPVVVNYFQKNSTDFSVLKLLSRCFGLLSFKDGPPRNLHNGLLRFFYQNHHAFFVGTATPYYDKEQHANVLMHPEQYQR